MFVFRAVNINNIYGRKALTEFAKYQITTLAFLRRKDVAGIHIRGGFINHLNERVAARGGAEDGESCLNQRARNIAT
jgi:hypothetical protein